MFSFSFRNAYNKQQDMKCKLLKEQLLEEHNVDHNVKKLVETIKQHSTDGILSDRYVFSYHDNTNCKLLRDLIDERLSRYGLKHYSVSYYIDATCDIHVTPM